MSVKVRDFGPIASGEVDLRPLTVFTGPANTGKSWLATLVYAMGGPVVPGRGYSPLEDASWPGCIEEDLDFVLEGAVFPEDPKAWRRSIRHDREIRLTDGETDVVRRHARLWAGRLASELRRCHGVEETSDIVRRGGGDDASLSLRLGGISYQATVDRRDRSLYLHQDVDDNPVLPVSDLRFFCLDSAVRRRRPDDSPEGVAYATRCLLEGIALLIAEKAGFHRLHYMPAGRGALMGVHALAAAAAAGHGPPARPEDGNGAPMPPGVQGDFLAGMLDIARRPACRPFNARLAESFERNVLGGVVDIDTPETGPPRVTYRPKGSRRRLPLMNASSTVREMSPVALFLRHTFQPGGLLVLEEPEAHLHPAAQKRLAQEVAKWVKAGLRVILTTHSEWVVEELSNIVARGERASPMVRGRGGPALARGDVGVWLFEHIDAARPDRGTTIKEVPWILDEGGFEVGFYDVLVELDNEWAAAVCDRPDADRPAR